MSAIAAQKKGSRYLGAPYVQISGDGYGACAVANTEDDGLGRGTYRVASVTVTCPGVNYTTPPTVTFLGGALKLGSAAALPTQTPVLLAGGALDLNGHTVTNALDGVGQITNGTS